MAPRLDLQTLLEQILGSRNVYFQKPPTFKMLYPCIIYRRDEIDTEFADNKPYSGRKRYLVTVIDADPDSDIPDKIAALPHCVFNRFYVADQLNHDVYKLFF